MGTGCGVNELGDERIVQNVETNTGMQRLITTTVYNNDPGEGANTTVTWSLQGSHLIGGFIKLRESKNNLRVLY